MGRRLVLQLWSIVLMTLIVLAGCAPPSDLVEEDEHTAEMVIPTLSAISLEPGEKLKVVATTSMIGDVVAQVAGSRVESVSLMDVGQDPHTYEPAPEDVALLESADVVFSNGLDYEEGLIGALEALEGRVPVVPVSAGVDVIAGGHEAETDHAGEDEHEHAEGDPHTWLDPRNVMIWADHIADALSMLDPAHADIYAANAQAYRAQLEALDAYIADQVARIPESDRKLVTDHEALAYFARRYGFEVVGAVIPNVTTSAQPAAADLAALVDVIRAEQVRAIFVSTSVSDELARTVAAEVGHEVQIFYLYHELGGPGSGAETYIDMMRTNVDTLVAALGPS